MFRFGYGLLVKIIFATSLFSYSAESYSCRLSKIGELDKNIINESSGLAVSNNYPNRLYHVNDSGGGSFFYTTDLQGGNTKKFKISGFFPFDIEDIALNRCPHDKNKDCLYVADVGDNYRFRSSVKIAIIQEQKNFKKKVKPLKIVKLKYPEKKEDAESFFVNPVNGDLYVISKNYNKYSAMAENATIYRLPAGVLNNKRKYKLQKIASLPMLDWLSDEKSKWDKVVTAADMNKKGNKLLLLTYKNAIEIDIENSLGKPITLTDNKKIHHLRKLLQQESAAYIDNEFYNGFIYSTELKYGEKSDIILAECNNSQAPLNVEPKLKPNIFIDIENTNLH